MVYASKRSLIIAGLEVNIYAPKHSGTAADPIPPEEQSPAGSGREVVVFFLLHGRHGSAAQIDPIAQALVERASAAGVGKGKRGRELLVVTFDHRNHGARLVDPLANEGWSKEEEKHNERHAVDMYAIQTGTSRDVSFLIDLLPSYLHTDDKPHPIVEWGVAGISLGGHATWLALTNDTRVKTGIPIIGCPDYLRLMESRAGKLELGGPPFFPASFTTLVRKLDPPYRTGLNPYLGKRLLVLSGKEDKLVPWDASQEFVEGVDVGEDGVKKVSLYEGVGHECTPEMVNEMADFIADYCL
ncbi:hypothetical protein Hypma_014792 [Hypsizygus marmoreus]|uniref:Peptidase S9 prolyl oligopeptidase catalytic domain-containing protein n=1 Tax=Hypsizygus marmoreus TaxID=39966 RepID=A0A369K8C0_HYPMA|nr:hypothetical protein Hypma_014792 [Hypsizygus marmoreus]